MTTEAYEGMAGVYRQSVEGPPDPHRWCWPEWPCGVTGASECDGELPVQGTA